MRGALAALVPLLVAAQAQATSVLGSGWPEAVLEGERQTRCQEWARKFEQAELERTRDLQLPAEEAAAWAKARGVKAAQLCRRVVVTDKSLPEGFATGAGLTEADLLAWQKAATAGASQIRLKTPANESQFRNASLSGCSQLPDGKGSHGDWIWCRSAAWDGHYNPASYFKQVLVRVAAIGGSVFALVGLGLLLFFGKRAAKGKPGAG